MTIQHGSLALSALSLKESRPHDAESEGWLLSYLDVFILIVALLVIMLVRSNPSGLPDIDETRRYKTDSVGTDNPPEAIEVPRFIEEQQLFNQLEQLISDHRLTIDSNSKRINVRLGDSLLFDSSKAIIKRDGKFAIQQLVPILKKINQPIIVEGHTDDEPINTVLYPSNWELAAARANSVLHYLVLQGIPKNHVSAISYADTRPLKPNDSKLNRSINRRVNLVILLNSEEGLSDHLVRIK